MRTVYRKSFERDLAKARGNAQILGRLRSVIQELESVENLDEIASAKPMQGWDSYYRIRIGDYRLGIKKVGDTVEVLRFLHRRDVYRYFP